MNFIEGGPFATFGGARLLTSRLARTLAPPNDTPQLFTRFVDTGPTRL